GAAPRRRRRRGGRGRRGRGGGDGGETDTDTEASGAPEDGAEVPADSASERDGEVAGAEEEKVGEEDSTETSSSSRRRRRRRRGSRGGDGEGDNGRQRSPVDEVTALKGSTRLEAKRQRRRDGRDSGRRRPVISESEFLARREAVERTM